MYRYNRASISHPISKCQMSDDRQKDVRTVEAEKSRYKYTKYTLRLIDSLTAIQCDQKRPSCSQCIRAGLACHGYRDELSMMFKNESDMVAKKAEKRYGELAKRKASSTSISSKEKESQTPGSDASTSSLFCWNEMPYGASRGSTDIVLAKYPTPPASMVSEIMPSIEDEAQGFFIANYVAQPALVPRGQFEWVPQLLAQPYVEDVLSSTVNAVALAGFGNAVKSPAIMRKAQTAYTLALNMTNSALRVKETAIKDSTLVSVILLGTYENIMYTDRQSVDAWSKHVNGACALFNLRGREQFTTQIGRNIFQQFYGISLLSALQMGTRVHAGMHELYLALQPSSNYDVHGRAWRTRIVDVMHDAINLNTDTTSDPVYMVNAAMAIDHELDTIKTLMPPIFHYQNHFLETGSEHLYGKVYSVYIDPWITQMWNNLRSCRLYLYKIIRANIHKGRENYNPPLFSLEHFLPRKEAAERTLRTTAIAIIASVPQITGMIPFSSSQADKEEVAYTLHAPGTFLDPAKSPGMMHLIWPLYASCMFDLVPYEMRQWVIQILHFIARRIGSRQAVVLAEELKVIQSSAVRDGEGVEDTSQLDFLASTLV
jgi:hypothetical protein